MNATDVVGSRRAWSIVAAAADVIGGPGSDEKVFKMVGGMINIDE